MFGTIPTYQGYYKKDFNENLELWQSLGPLTVNKIKGEGKKHGFKLEMSENSLPWVENMDYVDPTYWCQVNYIEAAVSGAEDSKSNGYGRFITRCGQIIEA